MAFAGSRWAGILTVLLAALIYLYKRSNDDVMKQKLAQVLSGLLSVEGEVQTSSKPKIAIGFGACQDLVVPATSVLTLTPNAEIIPQHFDVINSQEELQKGFAYFFIHGAAAERYIGNSDLFEKLVNLAKMLPDARWTLGGNAPVMGSRFALEGSKVLLGASLSKTLQKTLHHDITVTGSNLEKDDVHLILEYQTGTMWGPFQTPRANRFIVHNDRNNPTLTGLESFEEKLLEYQPDLVVISGLQMMDNFPFPPGVRSERLSKVQQIMSSQSLKTRVHFEMASFSDESLLKELAELVIPFADSLGMNEQELTNLNSILHYGNVSLVSDARPRIATVLDQMRDLFRLLQSKTEVKNQHPLTRLHVHTLAYQAIMIRKGSPWKNTHSAAAKAALTANRHTCGSKDIDVDTAQILLDDSFSISQDAGSQRVPFTPDKPVPCWEERDAQGNYEVQICLAPVLVCREVVQTAGGGDNISAAGLVLQVG